MTVTLALKRRPDWYVANHYKNKGVVGYYDFLGDRPGRYTRRAI